MLHNGGSTVTFLAGANTSIGWQQVAARSSGGVVVGIGASAGTIPVSRASDSRSGSDKIATVGGVTISIDLPDNFVVGINNLTQGETTEINNTSVAIDNGNLVIGSVGGRPAETLTIPTKAAVQVSTIPLDGEIGSTTLSSGDVIIIGVTLGSNAKAAITSVLFTFMENNGQVATWNRLEKIPSFLLAHQPWPLEIIRLLRRMKRRFALLLQAAHLIWFRGDEV